jgi:prepilin-type N-terminal cleavage/methylation domain-containing protein
MNRSGLTLLEVMLAVALIGIVFSALAYSQISNMKLTNTSRHASTATEIANDELEVLTQRVLADFVKYQGCPAATGVTCADKVVHGTHAQFTVSYKIESAGTTYATAGLIQIRVNVTGPSSASFSHLVSCMDVNPSPSVKDPAPCPN